MKLTPALAEQIADLLSDGLTMKAAAKAAGVPSATAYAWLRRGRQESSGPKRQIADAYDGARGEARLEPEPEPTPPPEDRAPETRREFLERHLNELRRYADQAEASGVIGPLPALKKQEREAYDELATIREREADPILGMSDEQLVYVIQDAIVGLPVMLREQISQTLESLQTARVVKIDEATG